MTPRSTPPPGPLTPALSPSGRGRPLVPDATSFPLGQGDHHPLLPAGEKVPEGRMRGHLRLGRGPPSRPARWCSARSLEKSGGSSRGSALGFGDCGKGSLLPSRGGLRPGRDLGGSAVSVAVGLRLPRPGRRRVLHERIDIRPERSTRLLLVRGELGQRLDVADAGEVDVLPPMTQGLDDGRAGLRGAGFEEPGPGDQLGREPVSGLLA